MTDFFQVGPRQLRLIGKRLGTTDLSITTGSGRTYDFEVQVVADLDLLSTQLRQMFPDATLQLAQVREKLVVEGQARDTAQVSRIIATLEAAIRSVQQVQITGQVENARNTGRAAGPSPKPARITPTRTRRAGRTPSPRRRRSTTTTAHPDPGGRGLRRVRHEHHVGRRGDRPGFAGGDHGQPDRHEPDAGHQPDPGPDLAAGDAQGPRGRAEPDRVPPDRGRLPRRDPRGADLVRLADRRQRLLRRPRGGRLPVADVTTDRRDRFRRYTQVTILPTGRRWGSGRRRRRSGRSARGRSTPS